MTSKTAKEKPFITVLLTAYNRREFLLGALKSAVNQTLPRNCYELLVIKNFKDAKIDSFCKREGIREILTSKPMTIGEYLHLGISESKTEVVSVLEDDDLFNREKLKAVYGAFKANEDLVYYHNAYDIINGEGKAFPGQGPKEQLTVNGAEDLKRMLPYLISVDASGNMSAISIRRSLFKDKMPALLDHGVKVAPDSLIFFLSASTHKVLIADSRALTYYRKRVARGEGESAVTGQSMATLEEFKESLSRSSAKAISDHEAIGRLVKDPICRECVTSIIVSVKLGSYAASRDQKSKVSIGECALYVRYSLRSDHKLSKLFLLTYYFASRIAPDPALKFYFEHTVKKFS